jgi:hypothetical protein
MSDEQEQDQKRDRTAVTLVIYGVTCAAIIGAYLWYLRRSDQRLAGLTTAATTVFKPCGCQETADLTSTGEDTGEPPKRRDANGRFIKTGAGDDGNG